MAGQTVPRTVIGTVHATALAELGETREITYGGTYKRFRYVTFRTVTKRGAVVKFWSANNYQVTRSASVVLTRYAAGVCLADASAGNSGWIQDRGINTYTLTDGAVAVNDPLMCAFTTATGTSLASPWASATGSAGITLLKRPAIGYARATDSGSICTAVQLNCGV